MFGKKYSLISIKKSDWSVLVEFFFINYIFLSTKFEFETLFKGTKSNTTPTNDLLIDLDNMRL